MTKAIIILVLIWLNTLISLCAFVSITAGSALLIAESLQLYSSAWTWPLLGLFTVLFASMLGMNHVLDRMLAGGSFAIPQNVRRLSEQLDDHQYQLTGAERDRVQKVIDRASQVATSHSGTERVIPPKAM